MLVATQVTEGDRVVLATDGLFDNVDEHVILQVQCLQERANAGERWLMLHFDPPQVLNDPVKSPAECAKTLADIAFRNSSDRTFDSPYAKMAKDNFKFWSGGRQDDITVVVAEVRSSKEPLGRGVAEPRSPRSYSFP